MLLILQHPSGLFKVLGLLLVAVYPQRLIGIVEEINLLTDELHTGEQCLVEFLLRLLLFFHRLGIAVTADGGIAIAGLQHQVALRLEFQRTVHGAYEHLYDVADVRQVNDRGEHILIDFCRYNLGEDVSKSLTPLVLRAFRVTQARVVNIHSRADVDLIAGLQVDVLSPDGDIAVGGTDGDAREGIDFHRAERRLDLDGALMALHVNLVDAVTVADMDATCQVLSAWQLISERPSHDSAQQSQSRRNQIGQEVGAAYGVGKGDMMAVRRNQRHGDIFSLQLHATLAIHLLVGGEVVLGENAAYDVWTLHIVVLKVHQHFVAYPGAEERAAAWRGHRRDDAHPRRGHGLHVELNPLLQFLALSFRLFLLALGPAQVGCCFQVRLVLLIIDFLILTDDRIILLKIPIVCLAILRVVLLGCCHKFSNFIPALF